MKFVNDLKKLKREDYEQCIATIIEGLENVSYIDSVHQFGSIGFPGISDIDLMVVIDCLDKYFIKKSEIEVIIKSVPNADYCFYHDIILICKDDIKYTGLFHSVENLKCLFGSAIQCDEIEFGFGLNQILAWNSYFYQSYLDLYYSKTSVSFRTFLLVVNNLANSIKLNDKTLNTNYFPSYKEEVDNLRYDSILGFDEKIVQKSNKLIEEGLQIIRNQENSVSSIRKFKLIKVKKNIYIFAQAVSKICLLSYSIYVLPFRYLKARNEMILFLEELEKNEMSYKMFVEMRNRFSSVKTIDI